VDVDWGINVRSFGAFQWGSLREPRPSVRLVAMSARFFPVLCALAFLASLHADDQPGRHESREIEGWTVLVDVRLLEGEGAEEGGKAIALLRASLAGIVSVVSADKVERLREVRIFLDRDHGSLTSMQYHPSVDWLRKNGFSPDLAKAVHIPVAARFLDPRHQQTQPWCVMHELAHAYHDQVLGYGDGRVKEAWERYVASGHGRMVLHVSGRFVPHYALTNEKEFFAEMTEAYFGTNDFVPFVHGQLKHEEPEIFALLREIWGAAVLE